MKNKTKKPKTILTRKEARKNKRKEKKQRRFEYYTNRKKTVVQQPSQSNGSAKSNQVSKVLRPTKVNLEERNPNSQSTNEPSIDDLRRREIRNKNKLESQMRSRRKKQMLDANRQEDVVIKHLEKQLKLNKRKSKGVPKSFAADGLDYLLEVCDSETREGAVIAEKQLSGTNDDFEEDFFLMTGKSTKEDSEAERDEGSYNGDFKDEFSSDNQDEGSDNDFSDDEIEPTIESDDGSESASSKICANSDLNHPTKDTTNKLKRKQIANIEISSKVKRKKTASFNEESETSEDSYIEKFSENQSDSEDGIGDEMNYDVQNVDTVMKQIKRASDGDSEDGTSDIDGEDTQNFESDEDDSVDEAEKNSDTSGDAEEDSKEVWEDIYGRKRRKDGTIIEDIKKQKYVPPAIRAKVESSDSKQAERLNRLKKQLKGLLNRLAESNMYNISLQIEKLYMNNSRFDMNNTITNLILEALVSPVNTPERLLMEHIILITVLHANVGTEVGAHFLQTVVKQFDSCIQENHEVENKTLDNLIKIIAQLYNFGLYDAKLLYEILNVLSERFGEKEVECILHILRGVGFSLRKDNPLSLKELIINLQKKATSVTEEIRDNSRVKFMLDILLAIKNNNVNKIPNYDTSYSEHLKKIMKGFIRKGNYVSPLNITLQDLLKADEKGKWWVVGSAWSGNALEEKVSLKSEPQKETFSQKLMDLARKQRMNTDTRRSIFCIIMSAEDYIDAFEKLMRLSLKNQQQREIINVIIHCALQEKSYNPYYAVLTQKFCEHDRKYQMMVKYLVWDKLKALSDHSASQVSNLAKLLTHLFIEKALPISALKVIQFSELDKVTVRFVRQVLLGILLHEDADAVKAVFDKIWHTEKLKMFRESLKLFVAHFLLPNLKDGESKKKILSFIQ